eukprot:CAMPEP_0196580750 /NCGR_PEP_ID=MMETSP1081-20130531/30388_1 /TAXON_ID=36882 /ORGANISM="Pyramimonas amylifera, Strain CCMP720" /LENGTH=235 /DNA_ID=CAMNT_0041900715 /DNA_START=209 /DNA_END=916 /DNA_ORIENTATION=+
MTSKGKNADVNIARRLALLGTASVAVSMKQEKVLARPANEAGDGAQVEAYLPETADGFYEYVVKPDRTPALRAEQLDPYRFVLPKTWKEQPVVNAISGNYCQPRCDEPTTEVKFGSPREGNMQVIIAPLTKLTRLKNQTVDQIGTLDGVINSIGPYITGDFIEPEDITDMREFEDQGRKYYLYELTTPYAITGQHNLACVTTTKNELLMLLVSSSDKQWNSCEANLRRVVESLRV